ncbi:MAG: prepilin-type N-terminal cleavage/methylation domain-containing protein [bacterium]|nr:prepilin-type N-terminal cleavage/methylation domain-containing protein [bacterium]
MKKNHQYHGFSLIEMMIVLLIVGIMISAMKSVFTPKNQDTLYAQNCINNIYGELNNFLNASMTSKNLYT